MTWRYQSVEPRVQFYAGWCARVFASRRWSPTEPRHHPKLRRPVSVERSAARSSRRRGGGPGAPSRTPLGNDPQGAAQTQEDSRTSLGARRAAQVLAIRHSCWSGAVVDQPLPATDSWWI